MLAQGKVVLTSEQPKPVATSDLLAQLKTKSTNKERCANDKCKHLQAFVQSAAPKLLKCSLCMVVKYCSAGECQLMASLAWGSL